MSTWSRSSIDLVSILGRDAASLGCVRPPPPARPPFSPRARLPIHPLANSRPIARPRARQPARLRAWSPARPHTDRPIDCQGASNRELRNRNKSEFLPSCSCKAGPRGGTLVRTSELKAETAAKFGLRTWAKLGPAGVARRDGSRHGTPECPRPRKYVISRGSLTPLHSARISEVRKAEQPGAPDRASCPRFAERARRVVQQYFRSNHPSASGSPKLANIGLTSVGIGRTMVEFGKIPAHIWPNSDTVAPNL